jgi:hypothetical protein
MNFTCNRGLSGIEGGVTRWRKWSFPDGRLLGTESVCDLGRYGEEVGSLDCGREERTYGRIWVDNIDQW